MTVPFVLCAGFSGGVLLADRQIEPERALEMIERGAPLLGVWPLLLLLVSATAWLIARALRSERRPTLREPGGNAIVAMLELAAIGGIAGTVSFEVGRTTFSERLVRAHADRMLAEAGSQGVRLVEARVAARASLPWGDRIQLTEVSPADGLEEPLPTVLELTQFRRRHDPAPPAAAERGPPAARSAVEQRPSPSVRERGDLLLVPGERVRLAVRIQPVRGLRNPGSTDPEREAARRGVGATARLVDPGWVIAIRPGAGRNVAERLLVRLYARAEAWREAGRSRVLEQLASAGALPALVPALALGDRGRLDPAAREAFRALGLAHLIALSGLHVAFIAGLAAAGALLTTGLVFRGRTPFVAALLVGTIAAAGFAWWVGAPRSVQRAAFAFALFAGPRAMGRDLAPEAVLAWVGWGLALDDPAIVFDPAARLSFAACAGLLLARPGDWTTGAMAHGEAQGRRPDLIARRIGMEGRSIGGRGRGTLPDSTRGGMPESLSIGAVVATAAALATAPLVLAGGGTVAVVAPVANAFAVPFAGVLVLPGAIVAVLGANVLPAVLLRLLVWPAAALEEAVVAVGARLPAESVVVEGALPPEWVAALAVSGLLALRFRLAGIAAGCWLVVSLFGGQPLPRWTAAGPAPRVLFFDVGQGDATLVEGRSGRILVDSGGGPPDGTGGRRLLRALRAVGVWRVDALVITHADLDHRGGAVTLLRELEVEELVLPAGREADAPLVALAQQANRIGRRVRWLSAGDQVFEGPDLRAEVMSPALGRASTADSRNDASLVLHVDLAGRRLLLMADAGMAVERALVDLGEIRPVDVLKLGHHGSRRSTGEALLRAATPRFAVLSAPCDGRRGLPSAEIFARLEQTRSRLLWTGRSGTIALRPGRAGGIDVERWATTRRCRIGAHGGQKSE